MSEELILFCNPADRYRGMLEADVAREYEQMSIDDFDSLVTFSPDYHNFMDIADFEGVVNEKQGREVSLVFYGWQQVEKIGLIESTFITSSYIFHPQPASEDEIILPDLEIVKIAGNKALDAAKVVEEFYVKNGWDVHTTTEKINERIEAAPLTTVRFKGTISLLAPEKLMEIAEQAGYDPVNLYF